MEYFKSGLKVLKILFNDWLILNTVLFAFLLRFYQVSPELVHIDKMKAMAIISNIEGIVLKINREIWTEWILVKIYILQVHRTITPHTIRLIL